MPTTGTTQHMQSGAVDELSVVDTILQHDRSGANGDDAAVVPLDSGASIVVTTDTAVAGVHLHTALTPEEMGYRAAACALSDLSAMATRPIAVTAAISVPRGAWNLVALVTAGIDRRCAEHDCALVGGDLVAASADGTAPMSITVTCVGTPWPDVPPVYRSGARVGDAVYVTGTLGAAAAALRGVESGAAVEFDAYRNPPNRTAAAAAIGRFATAMLDVSDGLALDAQRLCSASQVGMTIDLDLLPLPRTDDDPPTSTIEAATFGDEYELLFTAAADAEPHIRSQLARLAAPVRLTRIGIVADTTGALVLAREGQPVEGLAGYVHS